MAEGRRVRGCDAVGIRNCSEDGHGIGEFSDSPPGTIDSGNDFFFFGSKSI